MVAVIDSMSFSLFDALVRLLRSSSLSTFDMCQPLGNQVAEQKEQRLQRGIINGAPRRQHKRCFTCHTHR
jgi:hypothetical protein